MPIGNLWWVVGPAGGPKFGPYQVVESPTRPPDSTTQRTVAGPFQTPTAAQQWISQHQGHFHFHIPNPLGFLAWIQDVGHWIGVAVANITDIHMWISLGWLILGGFLLVMGMWLWIRGSKTYQEFAKAATEAGVMAATAA